MSGRLRHIALTVETTERWLRLVAERGIECTPQSEQFRPVAIEERTHAL